MRTQTCFSDLQAGFRWLINAAERGAVVTVTRHGEPAACVIGHKCMSAITETLELLENAEFMDAVAAHRGGRTKFGEDDAISG